MGKNRYKVRRSPVIKYAVLCALTAFAISAVGCTAPSFKAEREAPSPSAFQSQAPVIAAAPSLKPAETAAQEGPVLLALADINARYAGYGEMTIAGMTPEDYDKAMAIEWRTVKAFGEPEEMSVDLSELMDYGDIERCILNLAKYDGVGVSVIGESEQGRNIYTVELSFGEESEEKPFIMLTGGVHAREFAGPEYLIKLLNDIVVKAGNDEYTRLLLENATIIAVPLVNPDGRQLIIEGGDPDRKSNANGVDLNRAMPSVNAGQHGTDRELNENISLEPGLDFFPGYRLGSQSETQAMMKWFDVYIPAADVYIDLHQQGGVTFYNKGFITERSDELSRQLAEVVNELLKDKYPPRNESDSYGLAGEGGTFTDYAKSAAEGFTFSYRLGRMVLNTGNDELPLIFFRDIDEHPEYYKPVNTGFKSISIEIGRNRKYLGPSEQARRYRANEFNECGWKKFLTGTIELTLGEDKTDTLRSLANR